MYSLYVLRTSTRSADALPRARAGDFFSSGIEVCGEAVPAALPSEAGFPVAAERAGGVEPVVGVGPDHAGPQPLRHPQDPAALLGPHPGGQTVRGVVGLGDRLVRGPEREHREHRPEDLFPRDPVRLADAGEQRRREPVAAVRQLARRGPALRALRLPRVGQLADLVELLAGVDWADVGALVQRVAEAQRAEP